MRKIGIVTVSRSDYGIYYPLLCQIKNDSTLLLELFVAGMHLSPEFGLTVNQIEADGFRVSERVEMLISSDSPEGTVKAMGVGLISFAQTYSRNRPDILTVLGDRFEMHTAALAALPFNIPIAHIHGGELTFGAIDDSLRHSITKLSHLHFPSTQEYGRRILQMGEEPWRVVVAGSPSLDNIHQDSLLNLEKFRKIYKLTLADEFLLVTFHPVTLEYDQAEAQIKELLAALEMSGKPVLFTMANADPCGRLINEHIKIFTKQHQNAYYVDNLGLRGYLSAMSLAKVMVGNSSSGIIEAASFQLPVVNIGTRQEGRIRGRNVIDVAPSRAEILDAIELGLSEDFRVSLEDLANLYGDGHASERIVGVLKEIEINQTLLVKRFQDQ